jgi:hypothetical protein
MIHKINVRKFDFTANSKRAHMSHSYGYFIIFTAMSISISFYWRGEADAFKRFQDALEKMLGKKISRIISC